MNALVYIRLVGIAIKAELPRRFTQENKGQHETLMAIIMMRGPNEHDEEGCDVNALDASQVSAISSLPC